MIMLGWIFGITCLIVAIVIVGINSRKTRRTMETLDSMLEQAVNGGYKEDEFDESRLSALETRFADYLSANAYSAQNTKEEKENIKELIGDISHQTKTPIANLLLYTELLQEENLSPQAKIYADTLHDQSEKLRFLIDALVKLSRLENGIIKLKPEKNSILPILQQVRKQFEKQANDKNLKFTVNEDAATAYFDPKWTAEALCNLVDNAIKYTEKGSVSVSLMSYESFLRIDVADTGFGIPEQQQAQIFSRFYRGDRFTQQDGLGIGLHLAREILRSESGYIKLSSDVQKGSVFSVFLPL